jgi:hypothetical protein
MSPEIDENDSLTENIPTTSAPRLSEQASDGSPSFDPVFLELVQGMYAAMPLERQRQVKRLGEQNLEYVKSTRDKMLSKAVDRLCNNAASALFGGSEKRRALFVIGESDSGKTRALEHLVASRPEFQPRQTSKGVTSPFIQTVAPKPVTIKGFATNLLKALRYPVETTTRLTEQELFDLLKEQIKKKRVIFIWIDEMQHIFKGNTIADVQKVSDIIKSLLQIPGWPLHMILSGIPTLASFLVPEDDDRQLRNRSYLMHFRRITKGHFDMMLVLQEEIMKRLGISMVDGDSGFPEVVRDTCNTPDFMERLAYSSFGAFGTMIKRMQMAASEALIEAQMVRGEPSDAVDDKSSIVIGLKHYAAVYELETGASSRQNLFLQDDWRNISPLEPLKEIFDDIPEPKKGRGKKGGK